jgi:hypothetical protein
MSYLSWMIVPAPGLHRLPGVSHVEISSNHISPPRHPDEQIPPDIQYAPECPLPSNLEVLRISPWSSDYEVLWKIVDRMASQYFG